MEVKRRKKKKSGDETVEPTKEENAVGKYLRWNCPTKSSTMMGNKVDYFIASKAVDCLMDSNWASGKKNTEILFTDRDSVVDYLDRLLTLGFFSRVVRIKKMKGKDKGKEKEKEKTEEGESKKKKKEKKSDDTKKDEVADEEEQLNKEESETQPTSAKASTSSTSTTEEGKKKKKVKVKLELHDEQIFFDGEEAYVWIFDPVHPKTLVMGILVVLATIAICLFPLWPDSVREGVWYISVIAAVGIGMILFLAVFRYVLFAFVWAFSAGRHHFWLLPNLTEECGFFESFKPAYTHEYKGKPSTDQNTTDKQAQDDDTHKEEDKDTGSEDKETGEAWVKLTEEEVEKAKMEANMEEEQEDQIKTEQQDESNGEESVGEVEKPPTVTSSDPVC